MFELDTDTFQFNVHIMIHGFQLQYICNDGAVVILIFPIMNKLKVNIFSFLNIVCSQMIVFSNVNIVY
jgi:hypothetical protein